MLVAFTAHEWFRAAVGSPLKRQFIISVLAGTWLLAAALAGTDTFAQRHEFARGLKDAGQIVPLSRITERARRQYKGRVLEAELEDRGGRYVYQIELLDRQGVVHTLEYDAQSGERLRR
jgi:uncharacterized membrane protein YkoI